jgi:hypothetical protein
VSVLKEVAKQCTFTHKRLTLLKLQTEHFVTSVPILSNPFGQFVHVDPLLLYIPTSQDVQSDSNVFPSPLDFPATQFSHALPAVVLYFPAVQSSQLMSPSLLDLPAEHVPGQDVSSLPSFDPN